MRRLLALLPVLAACGGPSSFVRGDEVPVRRVVVRSGLAYEKAFEEVLRVVSGRLPVASSSAEEGRVETRWSADWPKPGQKKYRVRAIVRFEPDRRAVLVRADAEYGKPESARAGSDSALRDVLAADLEATLGAERVVQGPAPQAPERVVDREGESAKVLPLDVRLRVDFAKVYGLTETDTAGSPDSSVHFDKDAELGRGPRFGLEASIYPQPKFAVALGYSRGIWTGEGTLERDEFYDGTFFPAGTRVDARLDVEQVDVTPKFVLDEGRGGLLEAGLRLSYLRMDFEIDGPAGKGEEGESLFLLSPGIRGGAAAEAGPFIVGEFRAILGYPAITSGVEMSAGGGVRFGPVDLELGYRAGFLNAFRGDDENLRLSPRGPYLSLTLRF